MDDPRPLRLFGSELSPYSVKVRSYLRFKRLPHDWVVRDSSTLAEFQRHARLPLIPLVLAPDGTAMQDSKARLRSPEMKRASEWSLQRDPDIVADAQARKDRRDLERTDHAAPRQRRRGQGRDILALVKNPSGTRAQEFGEQIEGRGLAGAIGTDQGIAHAIGDDEVDVAGHDQRAEALV